MVDGNSHLTRRAVLKSATATTVAATGLAGVGSVSAASVRKEVEVEMSDGVTIRGQLFYPTDESGEIADGPFPVIATFNPYSTESDEAGSSPPAGTAKFVAEGYISASFEVRGTGGSGGRFRGGDPREQRDYGELIYWLSDRPRSTGKIGLYGASYLGLTQFLAARGVERVGGETDRDSPLEAIVPIVTGVDGYRNVLVNGGLNDAIFSAFWINYTFDQPVAAALLAQDDMGPVEQQETFEDHLTGFYEGTTTSIGTHLGARQAYRGEYWRKRSWEYAFPSVIDQDVAVFTIQGWHDIFQPGVAHVYTQLQNLQANRPQFGPMEPTQPISGKYQCVIGSLYHVSSYGALQWAIPWFDRFLKGERNGIDDTDTPLHLFQLFGNRWIDARTWPLPDYGTRSIDTYYLRAGRTGTAPHSVNDGALTTAAPENPTESDPLPWRLHNPCHQGTDEEGTFGLVNATGQNPCVDDSRTFEAGTLTYTTPPFSEGRNIVGPISASLYASATSTNTSWAVVLSDVAPDGSSTLISKGQLLGSLRALDEDRTWYVTDDDATPADDGQLIRPHHPYTQASEEMVEPGAVERYDILLDPVCARIRPDHRLRLALRTNASWAQPFANDLDDVIGTYQIQRNGDHASFLNVPFVSGLLPESDTAWVPCAADCGTASTED